MESNVNFKLNFFGFSTHTHIQHLFVNACVCVRAESAIERARLTFSSYSIEIDRIRKSKNVR